MKEAKNTLKKWGRVKKLLRNLFSVRYQTKGKFGQNIKRYKVITILFIKLKFSIPPVAGSGNKVYINNEEFDIKELFKIKENLHLEIWGNNNSVYISDLNSFLGLNISIRGNNNTAKLNGLRRICRGMKVDMSNYHNNREVSIGENCFINHGVFLQCCGDNVSIKIGSNCALAAGSIYRTTDFHKVYDINTNERLNPEKSIIIADNVWMAGSIVSKGAVIPYGCIVGANSFVNKKFEEPNCIIAGAPASIKKRGVRWEL